MEVSRSNLDLLVARRVGKRPRDHASSEEASPISLASMQNICSLAASAREAESSAAAVTGTGSSSTTASSSEGQTHYNGSSSHAMVVAHAAAAATTTRASTESGDESNSTNSSSLLDPYSQPCFRTIRQTFHRFQAGRKRSEEVREERKVAAAAKEVNRKRSRELLVLKNDEDDSSDGGSEEGYAGSASSNTEDNRQTGSGEDSSEDSSNDCDAYHHHHHPKETGPNRKLLCARKTTLHNNNNNSSSSSEIADFSSTEESLYAAASSPITGLLDEDEDDAFEPASSSSLARLQHPSGRKHSWTSTDSILFASTAPNEHRRTKKRRLAAAAPPGTVLLEGKTPIMALGCDVMAHVLTFLEPPDVLDVLSMPLSKDWIGQYTRQPELWRVLCVLEPFKANIERQPGYDSDDDDAFVGLFPFSESALLFASDKQTFGKYRLLYSSFVKCMRYLIRIKDDAVNGRPLSVVALGDDNIVKGNNNIGANQNLRQFLSQARGASAPAVVEQVAKHAPIGLFDNDKVAARNNKPCTLKAQRTTKKTVKYGQSMLTQRLLGPSVGGSVAEVELPWSCAIYSIVNWMVAFSGVEGIQTMCLKVLPFLLEDEQQRITAQRVGLTDVILRCMLLFRNSSKLHTAAFHTIVLLARPLGGREGMLFHTSMVNSSGIFGGGSNSSDSSSDAQSSSSSGTTNGKSGIAVLLDSMRRFRSDNLLQSMGCWSLVNIALAPAQKEVLVKLGGIEVTAHAMMEHPLDAEVQFRALFALINLVIPCASSNSLQQQQQQQQGQTSPQQDTDESTEREVLDEMVDQIIDLVVLCIKNFCSNEAILNRACLVLHNLSLTPSYHTAMLQTPTCYQMLEWCLSNYRTDQVLQQSAAGTLHRLQVALSNDEGLRSRFALSVQSLQQQSLKEAHLEAVTLCEMEEEKRERLENVAAVGVKPEA